MADAMPGGSVEERAVAVAVEQARCAETIVVGVAECVVSRTPGAVLVTHGLGSCLGVTAFDPVARVGGLLHFMLGRSRAHDDLVPRCAAMFGDTGVTLLMDGLRRAGARAENLILCAAGGGEILDDGGRFRVGLRNRAALRRALRERGLAVVGEDTGGSMSRRLALRLGDGTVVASCGGKERVLWRP